MSILLGIFTFVLILTSVFLILLVLAQKAKSDGGMGAAMGGGMAEATFGADTGNVLSKATINAAIVFFVLSFALYLGRIYEGSMRRVGWRPCPQSRRRRPRPPRRPRPVWRVPAKAAPSSPGPGCQALTGS